MFAWLSEVPNDPALYFGGGVYFTPQLAPKALYAQFDGVGFGFAPKPKFTPDEGYKEGYIEGFC